MRRKNIIPPSQRKTSFVLSYAMGGIGVGEATILFLTLVICIIMVFIINIFAALMINTIFVMLSLYLVYTDSTNDLKGWEKILRNNQYLFSKKTFLKKEVLGDLNPYKFDDEKERVSIGKNRLSILKIDGKDIFKMSSNERENLLQGFAKIISGTECNLSIYKKMSEPEKTEHIEYFNNMILEAAKDKSIDKEQKKSIIKQLKGYSIEEILKKMNRKDAYYLTIITPFSDSVDELESIAIDFRDININTRQLGYEEIKDFLDELYNPIDYSLEVTPKELKRNIAIKIEEANNKVEKLSKKKKKTKEIKIQLSDLKKEIKLLNSERKKLEKKFNGKIKITKNYIKTDSLYYKFVTLGKKPLYADDGWGVPFVSNANIITLFKVNHLNQDRAIKNLDIAIQRNDLKADNYGSKSVSKVNENNKINELYREIIDDVNSDQEKLKDLSILFMIKAPSLGKLKKEDKKFSKLIKKTGFTIKHLPYVQFDAFESFLPKNSFLLRKEISNEMTSSTIASSFPMIMDDFIDKDGIYLSNTSQGGEIYWNNELRDDYRFNSNSIILGSSGSGKSVTTFKLVANDYFKGNKIFIIDPEQEYKNLSNSLGGKVVDMGGSGSLKINPLVILKSFDEEDGFDYIGSHVSFLSAFFNTTNSKLDQEVQIMLQRELVSLYKKLKITNKKINDSYSKIKWPIFDDFLSHLKTNAKKEKGKILDIYELTILIISQYCSGGVYSNLWNNKQELSFKERMIVFDTSSLINDKFKIAGQMLFITKIIWSHIQENKKMNEKLKINKYSSLYIDEAHLLMNKNNLFALEWIQMVTKRIRKYNGKLFLITQNVKDFLGDKDISHYTEGILNNISYSFIGKMQPKDLESLDIMYSSIGGLNDIEKYWIANSGRGKFLLKIGDRIKYFIERVNINPYEAELFAPQILDSFSDEYLNGFDNLVSGIYDEKA